MNLEEGCRRKRIKLINRGKGVKFIEIIKNYQKQLGRKRKIFFGIVLLGVAGGIINS